MTVKRWPQVVALVLSISSLRAEGFKLKEADRHAPVQTAAPADDKGGFLPLESAPGFTATLWAAEPLLANPMAISFDARGRLHVAETHRWGTSALELGDYPELAQRDLAVLTMSDRTTWLESELGNQLPQLAVESERVRVIEDTNDDGRADDSRVIADGFDSALSGVVGGILAEKDRVWVAHSPDLWQLALSSEGGRVTTKALLQGFGVHVGSARHGVHGPIRGPDGMLYFTVGDRGADILRKDGTRLSVSDSGAVFRCASDGSQLEVVATGFINPVDLAFDDFGSLFTADAGSGSGDEARWVYVLEGSDSGWRIGYQNSPLGKSSPWLSLGLWKPAFAGQPAYILPPVENIEKGPQGLAYHPGSGLNSDYHATFFSSHFGESRSDSGIRAYTLEPRGAGFAVTRATTLVQGALTTDITFGPDSRLYFSDWGCRWPWPRADRGRIYVVDASEVSSDERAAREETLGLIRNEASRHPPRELARMLSHHDQRVRLAAQFALGNEGEINLPLLVALAENQAAPRLARIHALWAAGQLAERVPGALNHLPALLRDGDSEVRAQAARLLGDYFRFEAFQSLTAALKDPAPRVALFAAQSLGKLKRKEAILPLIELLRLNDDEDVVLRHAVVVALARLGPDPSLEKTIRDPSRAVRLGGLLAYRRLGDAAITAFLDDFDPSLVREAALAINDAPIESGLPELAAKLENTPLDDGPIITRAINAHFLLGTAENAKALGEFASRAYVPIAWRTEAIERLAEWAMPPARDRITGVYRARPARDIEPARDALRDFLAGLSGQTPEDIQTATINAVAALKMPGTGHALWDVVFQEAHPVRARIAALRALERLGDLRLEVAAQHAGRSRHEELRRAALDVLGRQHPAVSLPILKAVAQQGAVADLRVVFPIVATMADPRADEILIDALQRLRSGKLPIAAEAELIDAAARRTTPLVSDLVAQIETERHARGDRLGWHHSALEGGDPGEGKRLFERDPRLGCVRCHEDVKSFADSISLGSREKTTEEALALLDAMVNPNARVSPGSERSRITMTSGHTHAGVVFNETNATIHLRRADGTEFAVQKDQVADREIQHCAMSASAGDVLSRTELRDLFAYVMSLQQRPNIFPNASLHLNRID